MVTDQQIADAVQSLIQESNPNTFATVNGIVQELQAKLGEDLSHKVDFISNQINLFYDTAYSQPQQPQSQSLPSNNRFALQQNPNLQPRPPAPSSVVSPAAHIFNYPPVIADANPKFAASCPSADGDTVSTATEVPKTSSLSVAC